MDFKRKYSILYPDFDGADYKKLSETTCHDLALDTLCKNVSENAEESKYILSIISSMTRDPRVAAYRQKIFCDILKFPSLRKQLMELFEKLEFIRDFGLSNKYSDEKMGIPQLFRRMATLSDYIICVEALQACLTEHAVESEGLKGFKKYVDTLYHDACFAEMKADIAALKVQSAEVKSVTVGININEKFEATELGLISINNKFFKKSGVVSTFADSLDARQKIHEGTDWNGDMHYHPVEMGPKGESFLTQSMGKRVKMGFAGMKVMAGGKASGETMASVAKGDGMSNSTFYLSNIANKMLHMLLKKLRDTLSKYADVAVVNISQLIPEFVYYIRFAEFIEESREKGYTFCEANVLLDEHKEMQARGFYNLRLIDATSSMEEIVTNDLDFDNEHTLYIFTGANRGGKTTVTQAIGILYALAQGGIFVPATSFAYRPLDCVYTHFPADEDKTLDLGRLGEECVRFKENYSVSTKDSLYLLNESFSTTSFEEGYYIAKDAAKALLKKEVKTIYNTHMHKLGKDIGELNLEATGKKAASLVARNDAGKRTFKIEVAPPEELSYAQDIAKKYGVTYEMLTDGI